jgi:LuxR family maltose regulon positive regulatory protein
LSDETLNPSSRIRTVLPALEEAVDSRDWEAATRIVRGGWFALAAEHSDDARRVLERIPSKALRAQPLLAMELGILLNQTRFHRIRALRHFISVIRVARSTTRQDLSPVDRVLIRAAESGAFRLLGRYENAASAARAALELLNRMGDDDRQSIGELPRVYTTIAMSLFYAGRETDALHAASTGLAETRDIAARAALSPIALLGGIHALRGDLAPAREYIETIRTGPWPERRRNGFSGIFYRIAESTLALEAFDTTRAREELEKLDAMDDIRSSNENWAVIGGAMAMVELVEGRAGAGLALLDELVHARGGDTGSRRSRAHLATVRSCLLLALGHPDGASAIIARDLPDSPEARIALARTELALGNTGTALNGLRTLSGAQLSTRQRAEVVAIDLGVLLRLAPTPRQSGVVQRLGYLLERSGLRLPVALLPHADFSRVVHALREGGFDRVVAGLPARGLLADVEPDLVLSRRELAVLEQLMHTSSASEIAATLVVSRNTVKSQLRSVYRKLEVTRREDAIAVALERHLLADPHS